MDSIFFVSDYLVGVPDHILGLCEDANTLNLVDFDQVWPGWGNAPTDMLIIDEEYEFLFSIYPEPESFQPTPVNTVSARPRVFDPNLKATFPAFSATPVIIIGAPTQDEIDSKEWTATLWHEHFHQFQMSFPGYFEGVEALGLSGGDQTGMWMINYPFPYDDEALVSKFHEISEKLLTADHAINFPEFSYALSAYLSAKNDFSELAGIENYKYFQFQIWQEGLARYTELIAFQTLFLPEELSGEEYPFQRLKAALEELAKPGLLRDYQRVAFYSFGLVEGLVLDAANPNWKELYWQYPYQVDSYFE